MISLFSIDQLKNAKHLDEFPCECEYCHEIFYLTKHKIQRALNPKQNAKGKYCSSKCQSDSSINKIEVECKRCNKKFLKHPNQIKFKNNFCSRSCNVTYNNLNKIYGTRRSKLEVWLEEKLPAIYPNLEFHFNRKDTINSELDIYIPSMKLAFELNGIFHYEPIYGKDKLNQIQNNDNRKFQACLENNIELCIIDTSSFIKFKELKAIKYINIIKNIIDKKSDP